MWWWTPHLCIRELNRQIARLLARKEASNRGKGQSNSASNQRTVSRKINYKSWPEISERDLASWSRPSTRKLFFFFPLRTASCTDLNMRSKMCMVETPLPLSRKKRKESHPHRPDTQNVHLHILNACFALPSELFNNLSLASASSPTEVIDWKR